MNETINDPSKRRGRSTTARVRERRKHYSLDATEGSSVPTINSQMKTASTQCNGSSSDNTNVDNISSLRERWSNYQSRNLGSNSSRQESMRLEVGVNDYRSPRFTDKPFSPAYSECTIKQKNSKETSLSQEERNTRVACREDEPNNRDSTVEYRNNNDKEEEEDDNQDNSFHLGLESMETDISSLTDTMYGLNPKYQNFTMKNNLGRSRSFNHYDKYEEDDLELEQTQPYTSFDNQHQVQTNLNYNVNHGLNRQNEGRLVAGNRYLDNQIDAAHYVSRQQTRRSIESSQFDGNNIRINRSNSNIQDQRIERLPHGTSYSRMNSPSYYSKTDNSNRRSWHNEPKVNDETSYNNISHTSPRRFPMSRSSPIGKKNSINIRNNATLSTEESSQSINQEWAMIAVNVAASILEAGECKEIAEAATAAILSVGGSNRLNRSSALEAAAEASTAVLSAGCNQITAATVAVTVLKSCEMVSNADNSSRGFNSSVLGANDCLSPSTPRAGSSISSRKNILPSLSENQGRDEFNFTEVSSHERNLLRSQQRRSSDQNDNRDAVVVRNPSQFSLMDLNHSHSSASQNYDEQQHAMSKQRLGFQPISMRDKIISESTAQSQLQEQSAPNAPMPYITNAINRFYLNTKESINNVLESEKYDFFVGCKSPTNPRIHNNLADPEPAKQIYSKKPALLSSTTSSSIAPQYMYSTPTSDGYKLNQFTPTSISSSTIEGSNCSVKSKKPKYGRKKSSKKSLRINVAGDDEIIAQQT